MISGMVQNLWIAVGSVFLIMAGTLTGIYFLAKYGAERKLAEVKVQLERRHK